MKGLDIAYSAKDAKQDFSHAIDQFQQGNHGLAAMSALGGIANLANAVGRFGEIRQRMNCDLAGARIAVSAMLHGRDAGLDLRLAADRFNVTRRLDESGKVGQSVVTRSAGIDLRTGRTFAPYEGGISRVRHVKSPQGRC